MEGCGQGADPGRGGVRPAPPEGTRGRCHSCGARHEEGELLCSQCGAAVGGAGAARGGPKRAGGVHARFERARSSLDYEWAVGTEHSRWPVLAVPLALAAMGLLLLFFGLGEPGTHRSRRGRNFGTFQRALDQVLGRDGRTLAFGIPAGLLIVIGSAGTIRGLMQPRTRRLVHILDVARHRMHQEARIEGEDRPEEVVKMSFGAWQRAQPGNVGVACFVGDGMIVEFRKLEGGAVAPSTAFDTPDRPGAGGPSRMPRRGAGGAGKQVPPGEASSTGSACPGCGALLPGQPSSGGSTLARCGSCGRVADLEPPDPDAVRAAQRREVDPSRMPSWLVEPPWRWSVLLVGKALRVEYRWNRLKGSLHLLAAAGVVAMGWFIWFSGGRSTGMSSLPYLLLFGATVLLFLYSALAHLLNRTVVTVDPGGLGVRHGPIPWPWNFRSDLAEIHTVEVNEAPTVYTFTRQTWSILGGKRDKGSEVKVMRYALVFYSTLGTRRRILRGFWSHADPYWAGHRIMFHVDALKGRERFRA